MAARAPAQLQTEAEKPSSNVLLLVDTSGSMEFKTDGTFPECNPEVVPSTEKSRWIDLVEVLTGSFNGYSCWAQNRSTPAFQDEFKLGSVVPYDFGYVNPYHRALSNGCVYGPGALPPDPNNPYAWPTNAVNTYSFSGGAVVRPPINELPTHPPCAGFDQDSDGLLDVYKDQIRFGLMTFDTRVSPGTGLLSGAADHESGSEGLWSYFRNWSAPTGGASVTGHPENCSADLAQEIGARNASAPPWEGRMIAFGPPDLDDNTERNGWIQQVLLSTRPYGATPIAGQLSDAREFLWSDESDDPFDADEKFGPRGDPNWTVSNCRKTILILLTDGEPNLDLRPFCEAEPPFPQTPGRCPYDTPAEIVSALRLGTATDRHPEGPPSPNMKVETYVIGFALGQVTLASGITKLCADLDPTADCGPDNDTGTEDSKKVQACCTLNEIAAAGSTPDATGATRKAYFAESDTQLRAIFTDILDDVVQVATRTMPVFSGAGGDASSKGFKFFSAFDPQPDPDGPALWAGVLERRRFVCGPNPPDELPPPPQEVFNPEEGDNFAANVNGAANSRRFITVVADDTRKSIRPFITTNDDGLGVSTGTQVFAANPSALLTQVTPEAMQVTAADCDGATLDEDCRDRILGHAVGIDDGVNPSRCSGGECRVFGGIFHSTPTVVPGRPSELLRDESYGAFTEAMGADAVARPTALYTSTVDGFLHAFNLAPFPGSANAETDEVDSPENNEFWAFIPPAVLPVMQNQYPANPAVLLDGLPIIKDVVSREESGDNRFERLQSQAQEGLGDWRTVLLQGFGKGLVDKGFFAMDITTPHLGETNPPTFLWQLTRDADGNELFGSGGTPLITTLFLDADSGGPREVAVAVLPGGDAIAVGDTALTTGPIMETDPEDFKTERFGRNYAGAEAARSLTIVRLDTGEVIRTFRPATGAGNFSDDVFTDTDIPAPITGQPKAFPEITGAVADRIFVGDRDGRMWRVDVASRNPSEWSMEVFYDAFEDGGVAPSQPVILAPVLSVNEEGDVTVAFATGDQEVKGAPTTMVNRVISLTEDLNEDNDFIARVNWIHTLTGGDRVTGPMVLFNSGLYYTSSRPPTTSTSTCDVGRSTVWGTHYEDSVDVAAEAETPLPTSGPAPAPGITDKVIRTNDGLVFGLSLEVEPTCASAQSTIAGNDSFGYGTVSMTTTVQPARFFLTYDVSGSTDDPRGVLEVRQELASPHLPVSFESWAMIYE